MIELITKPYFSRYLIVGIFLLSGLLHFLKPQPFVNIIPDFIPWHRAMVYISGLAEILGATGILLDKTRMMAAWGLIILLIAVFPANINMTVEAIQKSGYSWYSIGTILRLPLQFVLIYWIYWACL